MTITYLDGFHLRGLSSDTKPNPAPIGCIFFETDTRKHYIFTGGIWNDILGGTGTWSPAKAETLTNKRMVINDNDFETSSGANGLFSFLNSNFNFVPIGSAGLFLKVNNTGDGFVFADPAVTGGWDPDQTEELTNKTLNVLLNTIKQTTPASGALLLDNGTKFVPLAKGANNTFLGVNDSGVVGYYTVDIQGGGTNYYNALPSTMDQIWGWWSPIVPVGTPGNLLRAQGILQDNLTCYNTGCTESVINDSTRGRVHKFSYNSSSDGAGWYTPTLLFRREYDSYLKIKFRVSVATTYSQWMGFASDMAQANFEADEPLNDIHGFLFGRQSNSDSIKIFTNDGSANQTEQAGFTFTRNTTVHTIEILANSASNRFQYRFDSEAGTWNNITTAIPGTGIDMGLICYIDSSTSTAYDWETYLFEVYNKLKV